VKPTRFDDDCIVFTAILDRGVPTIPNAMNDAANRLCAKYGRTITSVGGNFEEVWFFVKPPFDEEEEEMLSKELR
jgi:hypothetical protein